MSIKLIAGFYDDGGRHRKGENEVSFKPYTMVMTANPPRLMFDAWFFPRTVFLSEPPVRPEIHLPPGSRRVAKAMASWQSCCSGAGRAFSCSHGQIAWFQPCCREDSTRHGGFDLGHTDKPRRRQYERRMPLGRLLAHGRTSGRAPAM